MPLQKNNLEDSDSTLKNYNIDEERQEIKEKVFDKHGYVCSDCGATENLDVHHILPRHM
jgi:5-methylcytosine-specific restriction endonuclease McrA